MNTYRNNKKKNSPSIVPCEAIEFAMDRLQEYIDFKESNELDRENDPVISDEKWTQFYEWFYQACQYVILFVFIKLKKFNNQEILSQMMSTKC